MQTGVSTHDLVSTLLLLMSIPWAFGIMQAYDSAMISPRFHLKAVPDLHCQNWLRGLDMAWMVQLRLISSNARRQWEDMASLGVT